MTSATSQPCTITIPAGQRQALHPRAGRVWIVKRGVVGMVQAAAPSDVAPLEALASPGDLLGIQSLLGHQQPICVQSVADATVRCVAYDPSHDLPRLLGQAYLQARRQARDLLRLRSGSVADRVRHLMVSLAERGQAQGGRAGVQLPTLRQVAWIIDSSEESVCRVLARLRDLQVLEPVAQRRSRVALRDLIDLKEPRGMTSSARAVVQGFSRPLAATPAGMPLA